MKIKVNTTRTVLGYIRSLYEVKFGISSRRNRVESIYNYHRLPFGLRTSGQPLKSQFRSIKESGVKVVLNLAPASAENALANESDIVNENQMKYIHLPVDFKAPTDDDFREFLDVIDKVGVDSLWVHCAANMRVSAFVYRYRIEKLGHCMADARKDLSKIWEPFGVWKGFIKSNQT